MPSAVVPKALVLLALAGAAAWPSVYLLATVPPMYFDLTILPVIDGPAGVMPHYPPGFAWFVQGIHVLARHFGAPAGLNDTAILVLVVMQHILLSASLLFFAFSCASSIAGRLAALVPFALLPEIAVISHGMQTEAPWLAAVIVFLGASIRILRARTLGPANAAMLFFSVLGGMQIRPTTLFLLPVLPVALAPLPLPQWRRLLVQVSLVIAIMVAALVTSAVVFRLAMAANGLEYASPWGRGAIEVIQRAVWRMEDGAGRPMGHRTTLVPALQAAAGAARLREAVPVIIEYLDRSYDGKGWSRSWGGAHYALIRAGLAASIAAADNIINEFCALFLRTHYWVIFPEWKNTLQQYGAALFGYTSAYAFATIVDAMIGSRAIFLQSGRDTPQIYSLSITNLSQHRDAARHLAANSALGQTIWVDVAGKVTALHLALLLIVVILASRWTGNFEPEVAALAFGAAVTLLLYLPVTSAVLYFTLRYVLPLKLLLAAALAFALARFATGQLSPAAGTLRG